MLVRLQHFLSPPVFFDEERTRKAALLNTVLLAACVAISFYVLTQVISADVSGLVIGGSFALMVGMLWWGLRRGAVQRVGVLFCGVAFLGLTIFAYELASPRQFQLQPVDPGRGGCGRPVGRARGVDHGGVECRHDVLLHAACVVATLTVA
jgi:hypothetical protein